MKKILILALIGFTINGVANAGNIPANLKNGDNVAVKLLDTLFNDKEAEKAFELYGSEVYIQHNPTVADGPRAAIEGLSAFMKKFPDCEYMFKRVLVDGDLVAIHSHVRLNSEDRGSAVVDIFRIENGRVVEHWDVLQTVPEKPANDNTMF